MKAILFATQNHRKLGEARLACDMFDIKIEQVKLEFDEIQSIDPKNISLHKAESAYLLVNKPVVVTDTFWNIPALNGFPGGYMKHITEWFETDDFLNLMKDKKDKSVSFTESIVYKDAKQTKVFSKEYWGKFVDIPRGTGNPMENVVEFEGHTLGERREQGGYSHKPEEYIWYDFAKWYSKL
jgi:non-canonical purine NTP pyrophosphatase (RdgB/HAM1 family)